jgi:putative addiction module component (TIGR02574 family)
MSPKLQNVVREALTLPEDDRAVLVEELPASLPPENDQLTDDGFYAELERRSEEYKRDPSCAVPWSEVEKTLLA